MRALKILGSAVAAVVVIAVLLLVVGVPSGFLTARIQERVERETGYKLTVNGATRIGLWPSLNVSMKDVTLQDPRDRDTGNRFTAAGIEADITLSSVWAGRPDITELVITKPVLSVPLLRERIAASAPKPAGPSGDADPNAPSISRITIADGAIVFSNLRDRVDQRIDGINADITMDRDRKVNARGSARGGDQALKFTVKAVAPAAPMERKNIPAELTLEAPGLINAPLTAKAEVRLNGTVVLINGLSGTFGDGAFNGWASVDVASKPLVKLDLDFQRLEIPVAKPAASAGAQPWSNATIDVSGLNYVDAQAKISAAELAIGDARFAPASVDTTLGGGVLKIVFSNLGAYGGQASGQLDIDASGAAPTFALRTDLTGVRALPLLKSVADFDKLDGRMQSKIAVRSTGTSQRAIMGGLNGTAFAAFQDGAIKGLNIAQMIRSLTQGTLSGWQENREQATDLTQLTASFKLDKGQAVTTDLNLVGPLVKMTGVGTVDLGTKMMAFRVEPKLVMTTEGQGRVTDPVGLGIPVIVDGSWSEPRIYPEMSGILENPDAAYAKLKEMGKGLFGPNGGGLGALGGLLGGAAQPSAGGQNGQAAGGGGTGGLQDMLGGELGKTLGNLIQQGMGGQTGAQGRSQGRSLVPQADGTNPPAPPLQTEANPQPEARPDTRQGATQETTPDSPAMNDVLRQLFNR